MEVLVKKTKAKITVIPKSHNGVLTYYDIMTGRYYSWDDLDSVRVKAKIESDSNSAIKIGVTPCVKTSIVTNSIEN